MNFIRKANNLLETFTGFKVVKTSTSQHVPFPVEFRDSDFHVMKEVFAKELTMVSPARLINTISACIYVLESGVSGDFV